MKIEPSSILIFTDGACTGNPGPGGWACIVARPQGTVHELGGGVPETTNNRMEMAAVIRALSLLEAGGPDAIILYTDSTYVIRGITQWIWGWRANGWRNSEGKDVANRELWEELSRQVGRLKPATIDWRYVRGHCGHPGNERCDEIAVSFAKKKPETLYVGPREGYFVEIDELPESEPLPEPKTPKATAGKGRSAGSTGRSTGKSSSITSGTKTATETISYLSYRLGVVTRYKTWTECEKNVRGQSGVKFKKAKSAQEEKDILKSWGLDSKTKVVDSN